MKKIMLALGTVIILTACKDAQKTMQQKPLSEIEGKYTLTELPGATMGENVPHIVFKPEVSQVEGNTGCNAFFGKYSVNGDLLSITEVASTEMDCGPKIMRIENSFLSALRNVGKASLTDSSLSFYSQNDERLLLVATNKIAP